VEVVMRRTITPLVLSFSLLAGCGDLDDDDIGMLRAPLTARCSVTVVGKGTKAMETDYIPHVVACENGGADTEALKVQAVAARTFAYYKGGTLKDGTSDQVYTCANKPSQKHYDAVNATAGQVLVWSGSVICSFFVAGAKPSTQSCVALASDPDPTSTEKYVTYNAGKSGTQVTQSSLGWISPTNKANRGCMSQNGSNCQSVKGKKYADILRFYYGADIQIVTATGSCVTPPKVDSQVPKKDAQVTKKDGAVATLDGKTAPVDGGAQPAPDSSPPPPAPTPDSGSTPQLPHAASGCSVGAGAGAASPAALLLLLLVLPLLRRRC
jgi:MYXO-CTERM domain-containing protein